MQYKHTILGETAAAWALTNAMKVKRKTSMEMRRGCGAQSFRQHVLLLILKPLTKSIEGKELQKCKDIHKKSLDVLYEAKTTNKKTGGSKRISILRITPYDRRTGGILPLIPVFTRFSALGCLVNGA